MTQTSNIGLKKIDGSENWRNVFDYHNDSMDLADEAIAGVQAGLTYVENGDTIAANAAYTEGKFICWKGEIYRIRTTINTTVTSANWTTYLTKMDGIGGALSQINGDLTAVQTTGCKMQTVHIAPTSSYTFQGMANSTLIAGLYDSARYHYAAIIPSNFTGNWPVDMYGTFYINVQHSGNDLIVTNNSGGVYITVLAIHSGI